MEKKKDLCGSSKGSQMNCGEICYLEILIIMTGRKTVECLMDCFMNFLIIFSLILNMVWQRRLAVLMVPMFQFYVLLKIPRTIIVIWCFFNCLSSLIVHRCFYGCGVQKAWLCPQYQSVLQFKNKQELTKRKTTNNTTNTWRLSKSWKLSDRWSYIPPGTLLFEKI